MRKIFYLFLFLFILLNAFFQISIAASNKPLNTAWEPWYPYEYLKIPSLQSSLTGLDVELIKLIAGNANYPLNFKELSWNDTLQALQRGNIDLATGATYSAERAKYVYFSKPYRSEENSLFVLRENNNKYKFHNVDELIEYIKQHHFHLAVKKNSLLADDKMNHFLQDPKYSKYIVPYNYENEALDLLLHKTIDGFVADRIVGSTLVWQARADSKVVEYNLHMKTSIHFIFSKKTVSLATVQAFDKAIDHARHNVTYRNNFAWYVYPVIMLQTTGKGWFKALDILGMIFFSISGVLIAYNLNKSFLSALLYAILPCMTGGILRDVIYNNRPVEALETPNFLLLICSVVLAGFIVTTIIRKLMQYEQKIHRGSNILKKIISRSHKVLQQLLIICDTLGLATLSVSGVMISLMARAEPLWLWGPFFAFLTASFGTIIRDIISKNEHLEDVVGDLYSEIGIIWSLILSIALILNAENIQADLVRNLILLTVTGVFMTRLIVHYFKVPNVYFK